MLRFLLLVLLALPTAHALSCAPLDVQQRIDDGAIVFTGTLVAQDVDGSEALRAFRVHTSFAGLVDDTAIVRQECWESDCGELPLVEYFVVAHRDGDELTLGWCDWPMPLQDAADELQAAAAYTGVAPTDEPMGPAIDGDPLAPYRDEPMSRANIIWIAFLLVALVVLWRWKPKPAAKS